MKMVAIIGGALVVLGAIANFDGYKPETQGDSR